ncbi:YnbE family lipoprotein [Phenylobacterium sp. J426]|uniref:YnbE family lipoprotein n=1 Tax=Phenylobacterium sp. J426 TaxID=2898439 RepID=UPI002151CD41|nr:YnbE family lipoprotein [Phenylobacterium sp. J426]MCR5874252.1 YnbE family lipoprotein [Phenylobacterium sp. J426]
MILRRQALAGAGALALLGAALAACTPTVRVEVAPINIYAKLDADVRLRLDEDVKALIQKNPELF